MSKRKRNAKRNSRARWWKATGIKAPLSDLGKRMHEWHMESHPHCTFGREPHFVPPSLGDEGFYLCDRMLTPARSVTETGEQQ